MLAVSMLIVLAAVGASSEQWQPSALRLLVTTVVGLLAPLFWPGSAATAARTMSRIVGWSAAAAALAAATLLMVGGPMQPVRPVIAACTALLLMLVLVHALVAAFEMRWRRLSMAAQDTEDAREQSGRMVATTLALLGSLPLWCGPVAELLAARHAWILDAVVGISPLTHLAVASGNDLLRNQWFYQHSNLAGLRVSYPSFEALAWFYATACLVLVLIGVASRRGDRPVNDFAGTQRT